MAELYHPHETTPTASSPMFFKIPSSTVVMLPRTGILSP